MRITKMKKCCSDCFKCSSSKKNKSKSSKFEYTSGESDSEFEVSFEDLDKEQKNLRLRFLWHQTYIKAKGASHILTKFGDLNNKIYIYGASNGRKSEVRDNSQELIMKKCIL